APHHHGEGLKGMLAGAWHAHIGWLVDRDPEHLERYVGDLQSDTLVRRVSKSWTVWSALGLALPALLGGLITWSWTGVLLGFIWGGLARVFLVQHGTWRVHFCFHLWGAR